MHNVLFYFSLLFTGIAVQAQNTIEVAMTNFNSNKGTVKVGLYDTTDTWLEKEAYTLETVIDNKKARVTFTNIPDGTYGVSCFHDENGNDTFDMFLNFIPKEDYGCSNGATGMFGPPRWEDAKFEIANGEVKDIKIKL